LEIKRELARNICLDGLGVRQLLYRQPGHPGLAFGQNRMFRLWLPSRN
jgi:hypothetical protein